MIRVYVLSGLRQFYIIWQKNGCVKARFVEAWPFLLPRRGIFSVQKIKLYLWGKDDIICHMDFVMMPGMFIFFQER